jgi:hypothetical protein
MLLEEILAIIAGLSGLGAFVTMFVNALKLIPGLIKDGIADKIASGIDLLVFVVVAVLYFQQVEVNWGEVDSWIQMFTYVLGLVVQIFTTKITHNVVRGTPLVGTSYSGRNT